jgi:hypothetical protein
MANKYTAMPVPAKEELQTLYDSGLSQVEVGERYSVSQKVIFSWFKKLGIKSRIAVKRNQTGINNSSWKGDKATYAALHKRVEVSRGKPSLCACCGSMDSKRYEWCNLTGRYEDINDYMRMCVPCHRKYDKNRKNSSKHVKRTAK